MSDTDTSNQAPHTPGSRTWINGRMLEPGTSPSVSAFDASVQHAVGLFETMHACETDAEPAGRVFRLAEHLERLATSAKELGLSDNLKTRPLAEAVESVVQHSGLATQGNAARVRLTITGGDLNLLQASGTSAHDPTIVIHVTPATAYPAEMYERGVGVTLADTKANPLNPHESHKTINYWWRLRELQQAATRGAGEAIVMQVTNHIAGGCVSNLFVVKDGALLTPTARGEEVKGAIPSPVLPGVTRAAVIELAQAQGIQVTTKLLTIDDVLDADELFLTNASFGVLPVVKVERKRIGVPENDEDAVPSVGEFTKSMRSAISELRRTDL